MRLYFYFNTCCLPLIFLCEKVLHVEVENIEVCLWKKICCQVMVSCDVLQDNHQKSSCCSCSVTSHVIS